MNESYSLPEVRIKLVSGPDSLYSGTPISSPDDAVCLLQGLMGDLDREMLCVVSLDQRNRPINYSVCSVGTINQSIASPREVYKSAILANAASIILVHNHPSGDSSPSKEDFSMTKKFVEAGNLLDIPVLDHVIIGAGSSLYYSFKENNTLEPDVLKRTNHVKETKTVYKTRQEEVKALTQKLEDGLKAMLNSESYKDYLKTMAKFPRYSFGNCVLIALQTNGQATYVCGYKTWESLSRHVKRGEKAIKILAPVPYKAKERKPVYKEGAPVFDSDGNHVYEEKEVQRLGFKTASVFDYAQTEGDKELPEIVHQLIGTHEQVNEFMQALKDTAPVPISIEHIDGQENGFYSRTDKKIVIRDDLSEIQQIKTTIHETAHSILHSAIEDVRIPRGTKELEAESVAAIVCSHFGIDSSDYSLGYINEWSPKDDLSDFKESLDRIQKTSCKIIDGMEKSLTIQAQQKQKISELASLKEAPQKVLTPSHALSM